MSSYEHAVELAQEAIGSLAAAGSILSHDTTLSQYQRWQGEALWNAAMAADQSLEALERNAPKTEPHVMYSVEIRAVHALESPVEALEPQEDLGTSLEADEDVWRGDR